MTRKPDFSHAAAGKFLSVNMGAVQSAMRAPHISQFERNAAGNILQLEAQHNKHAIEYNRERLSNAARELLNLTPALHPDIFAPKDAPERIKTIKNLVLKSLIMTVMNETHFLNIAEDSQINFPIQTRYNALSQLEHVFKEMPKMGAWFETNMQRYPEIKQKFDLAHAAIDEWAQSPEGQEFINQSKPAGTEPPPPAGRD